MDAQSSLLRLCSRDDIPEGRARGFDLEQSGQDSLFVVRFNGEIYAWRNACPHINGAPMAWRKDEYLNARRTHIACHAHGALFQPDSGECVQGPCLGKALQSIELNETESGEIFIDPFSIKTTPEER